VVGLGWNGKEQLTRPRRGVQTSGAKGLFETLKREREQARVGKGKSHCRSRVLIKGQEATTTRVGDWGGVRVGGGRCKTKGKWLLGDRGRNK